MFDSIAVLSSSANFYTYLQFVGFPTQDIELDIALFTWSGYRV